MVTQDQKKKIEERISSLERHTSCEFVCVYREASSPFSRWMQRFIPKRWLLESVETAAHLAFLHEEVFATAKRTGIMIFISECERAVYVLADKGIVSRVASKEFSDLGQQLAKFFEKESSGAIFLDALDAVAKKLGEYFPPHQNNINELSDHIR